MRLSQKPGTSKQTGGPHTLSGADIVTVATAMPNMADTHIDLPRNLAIVSGHFIFMNAPVVHIFQFSTNPAHSIHGTSENLRVTKGTFSASKKDSSIKKCPCRTPTFTQTNVPSFHLYRWLLLHYIHRSTKRNPSRPRVNSRIVDIINPGKHASS